MDETLRPVLVVVSVLAPGMVVVLYPTMLFTMFPDVLLVFANLWASTTALYYSRDRLYSKTWSGSQGLMVILALNGTTLIVLFEILTSPVSFGPYLISIFSISLVLTSMSLLLNGRARRRAAKSKTLEAGRSLASDSVGARMSSSSAS